MNTSSLLAELHAAKPVIGPSLLACDFAYAVKAARFALTEVTLGLMPGAGGTQTLPRIVGERRAKEIILTGKVQEYFNMTELVSPLSVVQVLRSGAVSSK